MDIIISSGYILASTEYQNRTGEKTNNIVVIIVIGFDNPINLDKYINKKQEMVVINTENDFNIIGSSPKILLQIHNKTKYNGG